MNPRSIRSILLPCALLSACCAQEPEDQATAAVDRSEEVVLQPSTPPVTAKPEALPEVRYYLIADT